MNLFFWRTPKTSKTRPETAAERATRMRIALRHNPATGELLITRRYKDACIDEVLEYLKERLSCRAK